MTRESRGDGSPVEELYRRRATRYDELMSATARWQSAAVAALDASPGATVVDVACGTGLNFSRIQRRIGDSGLLIGVDLSADMLALARARVARHGWRNVELLEADVKEVRLPLPADGALFSFTHDVLGSERAVAQIVSQLRPGARVSSVGPRLPGPWSPLNPVVRLAAKPFVTDRRGLDVPWRRLSRFAALESRFHLRGCIHVTSGPLRESAGELAAALLRQHEDPPT